MKKALFSATICILFSSLRAQVNPVLNEYVLQLTAEVQESPVSIKLNWKHSTATGISYVVYRKLQSAITWTSMGSVPITDSVYTDNTVMPGIAYEYRVIKTSASGTVSWGYVSSGIKILPDLINRGAMLILDTSITNLLTAEIETLKQDLEADGYLVTEVAVDRNDEVADVKSKVVATYNNSQVNYTSALVIGHVPVPYSGNLGPDAHPDHQGAWPTDLFYADVDGNWTDVSVNNTVGSSTRTKNVPGDKKYDQSTVPSTLEMEIGRIDFFDMPAFTITEEELLRKYLAKNHQFRNKLFVPQRRGLMDEGGFATNSAPEGFGQSGPRGIVPTVGRDSFFLGDYFTSLSSGSYLWSYGQGPGSYTSCGGVGTTSDFASNEIQSVFTMLFGSYFGDYDSPNNLMRASIASGTNLSCSWSSTRPIWYYHHMAMGFPIGYSARQSVNLEGIYFAIDFGPGFPTNQGVHNVLMGDPTIRSFYVTPPTLLQVSDAGEGLASLSWTASPDPEVMGYHIYRRQKDSSHFVHVNSGLVSSTSYTDSTITHSGDYTYFVRAVKLEQTASGTYYNESLGIFDETYVDSYVSINEHAFSEGFIMFPNPASDRLMLKSDKKLLVARILNLQGKVMSITNRPNEIDLSNLPGGVYIVEVETDSGIINKKLIIR